MPAGEREGGNVQLKLTWRVKGKKDLDLLVFEEQRIGETLEVLVAKGLLEAGVADGVTHVRSLRTNHQVNVLLSYEEANVLSGDILEIGDQSGEGTQGGHVNGRNHGDGPEGGGVGGAAESSGGTGKEKEGHRIPD